MDCNLFLGTYIIKILKTILSNPPHFNLSLCQSPISILYCAAALHLSSIHFTHFLPKQFPISIQILIHLPSKLFVNLLFALIYTPFNLSLFFFSLKISIHLSFAASSIAPNTFQPAFFSLNCSFHLLISPHFLRVLYPYTY